MLDGFTIFSYMFVILSTNIVGGILWKVKQVKFSPRWSKAIIVLIARIMVALPFSMMCAIRDYNVGFDTKNYLAIYDRVYDGIYNVSLDTFGFWLTIKLSGMNIFGYYAPLFMLALLVIIITIYTLELVSTDKSDFLVGLTAAMLFLLPRSMDQQRQFVAVVLFALSVVLWKNGNSKKAIICMCIAWTFHNSVLVPILILVFAYFMFEKHAKKWKVNTVVAVGCTVLSLFVDKYIGIIYKILPEEYSYLERQSHSMISFGLGGLLDLLPIIFCVFVYAISYNKYDFDNKISSILLVVASAVVFRIMGYKSYFMMRLFYYGAETAVILFCLSLQYLDKRKRRWFQFGMMMTMILYFTYSYLICNNNGIVPYRILEN